MTFAQVAVSLPVDGIYTYKIPSNLNLQIGHTVLVPFGKQKITGYIVGLIAETELTRLKFIDRLLDPIPAFEPSILPFFTWISNYYLAGLGEVISTALPKDYKIKSIQVLVPTEKLLRANWITPSSVGEPSSKRPCSRELVHVYVSRSVSVWSSLALARKSTPCP